MGLEETIPPPTQAMRVLETVDVFASGHACIVRAKWKDGRVLTRAYEPGDEFDMTRQMFDLAAAGVLTRAEAMSINDSIINFIEDAKV